MITQDDIDAMKEDVDILERLRNWETVYPQDYGDDGLDLYEQAANEIERLRALLA